MGNLPYRFETIHYDAGTVVHVSHSWFDDKVDLMLLYIVIGRCQEG